MRIPSHIFSSKLAYASYMNLQHYVRLRGAGRNKLAFMTWTSSKASEDREQAYGQFMEFYRRFTGKCPASSYVLVMERHGSMRWHVHMLVKFRSSKTTMKMVRKSLCRGVKIKWTYGHADDVVRYLSKGFCDEKRMYSRNAPRICSTKFSWLQGKWRSDLIAAGQAVQAELGLASKQIQDWYFSQARKSHYALYLAWKEHGERGLADYMVKALRGSRAVGKCMSVNVSIGVPSSSCTPIGAVGRPSCKLGSTHISMLGRVRMIRQQCLPEQQEPARTPWKPAKFASFGLPRVNTWAEVWTGLNTRLGRLVNSCDSS